MKGLMAAAMGARACPDRLEFETIVPILRRR